MKYPSNWLLKDDVLYPLPFESTDYSKEGTLYVDLLAGGVGAPNAPIERVFPAATALYFQGEYGIIARFYVKQREYIFFAHYSPNLVYTFEEYQTIFDQMLTTLVIE